MRISAKADYAVRAALELAAAPYGEPVKGEHLADRLIRAKRGARGGYWLARPPDDITIAEVIRAVEGPLANIQDSAPEDTAYPGPAEKLQDVWVAVRANLRAVLEQVTLADVRDDTLPEPIGRLVADRDAWGRR